MKSPNPCHSLPKVVELQGPQEIVRPFAFLTSQERRAIVEAAAKHRRCVSKVMVRRDPYHHLHIIWAPDMRRLK